MRYFDFAESATVRAMIAFNGPTWEEQTDAPSQTEVSVIVRAGNRWQPRRPWHLAWQLAFDHLPSPSGPWHDFDLVSVVGDRVIVGLGTDLVAFGAYSGDERWRVSPSASAVRHILVIEKRLIVLSDYSSGSRSSRPNLACYDLEGRKLWHPSPPQRDAFVGPLRGDGNHLGVRLFGGFHLTIDSETGEVVEKVFTK